jgi:hypothetical protein
MPTHTSRCTLIAGLILALLFAQGLRVCIHAYGNLTHVAAHAHDVAATHLESTLSLLDGHDESTSDVHVPLIGVLKHLSAEPLIAALFITLLLVLLPQQRAVWFAQPRDRVFRPPHGHYFSPPLRAPPR